MPFDYLAATTSASLTQTISWALAGVIVVGGLLIFGLRDAMRFSPSRVWAISSVAFAESIRRRVLWIIPLAVLGIFAVVQFTRAPDPQDAIRQSTKICLFATGVVVMVTTIILSCTSLPKEIENRVIFTIVTKPTTRLEIVLGKIVGFARVSGLILLIMGAITLAFLKFQESRLLATNNARLQDPDLDPAGRPVMEYYKSAGLLGTKSMELPDFAQVMARPRTGGFNESTRMLGGQGQYFSVAFDLTEAQRKQITDAAENNGWVYFETRFGAEYREPTAQEAREIADLEIPLRAAQGGPGLGDLPLPATPLAPSIKGRPIPQVLAQVTNDRGQPIVDAKQIGTRPYLLAQYEQSQALANGTSSSRKASTLSPNISPDEDGAARAFLAPRTGSDALLSAGRFYVQVYGTTPSVEYLIGSRPILMVVTDATLKPVLTIEPAARQQPSDPASVPSPFVSPPPGADPAAPIFLANQGRFGFQVLGREDGKGAVAAYHFTEAEEPDASSPNASLEVRIGLEGSAMDYAPDSESVVRMSLQVRNAKTGEISEPIPFSPENNRNTPVLVPTKFVSGGEFDVYVRSLTDNQYFGLTSSAVRLVTAERSFTFNLFKSLLTLWMMAILVVAVGVFCSTWLSWPIAIVLTLMILLGRWGVMQIGDTGSGLGSEVTQSLSLEDPTGARVVRSTVNFLQTSLNMFAAVLPDISRFSVTEDIERGISIPPAKMTDALRVLAFYGLPVTVLAYVILKRKEVAP